MKKLLKKGLTVLLSLGALLLLVACEMKQSIDGRWESPEYQELMQERFELIFDAYNLDVEDYYQGGSSAIVIKGKNIRYETTMNFDLRAAAEAIHKADPSAGTPEEIETAFFNPKAVYDAEKGIVTEIIFEGVVDAKEGVITLTGESHMGLAEGETMTYEVDGETLIVDGNGYVHKFIKKQ